MTKTKQGNLPNQAPLLTGSVEQPDVITLTEVPEEPKYEVKVNNGHTFVIDAPNYSQHRLHNITRDIKNNLGISHKSLFNKVANKEVVILLYERYYHYSIVASLAASLPGCSDVIWEDVIWEWECLK